MYPIPLNQLSLRECYNLAHYSDNALALELIERIDNADADFAQEIDDSPIAGSATLAQQFKQGDKTLGDVLLFAYEDGQSYGSKETYEVCVEHATTEINCAKELILEELDELWKGEITALDVAARVERILAERLAELLRVVKP